MSRSCETTPAAECAALGPVRPGLDLNSEGAVNVDSSADGEIEAEEAKNSKGTRGPAKPTKQEREDHERDHIPFRSWCAHCMRGKAKASGHASVARGGERQKPVISMDYAFLGIRKSKSKEEQATLEDEAVKAAKEANAFDFIMKLPKRFDTLV